MKGAIPLVLKSVSVRLSKKGYKMTDSIEYSPQGTSQNKQRLQEFLEQKDISLDRVKVSYWPNFPRYHGGKTDNNPKSVSFDDLLDDIQQCTVLVDDEIRWEVEIGSTKLTPNPPNTN